MTFRNFVMTYSFQVFINSIIGASIIYFAVNTGIRLWLTTGDIPEISYWQSFCVYFLFGVLRGDFRMNIEFPKK